MIVNLEDKIPYGDAHIKLPGIAYGSISYKDAYNNCKHCYIDNCCYLVNSLRNEPKATMKRMNELFVANSKITFSVNFTGLGTLETLKEHFEVVSVVKIPTGYYNGHQYHCIFWCNVKNIRDIEDYKERFKTDKAVLL